MISVCVFCVSDKCSAEIEVERAVKSLEGAVGIHRKRADMADCPGDIIGRESARQVSTEPETLPLPPR